MKKTKILLSLLILCFSFLFIGSNKLVLAKEKPSLEEVYEAYKKVLTDYEFGSIPETFGLKDISNDGIPELLANNALQIYTYDKDEGIRWLWDSWVICEMYYSEKTNRILYYYTYQGDEDWVVFNVIPDTAEWDWYDRFGIFNGQYYHESFDNVITKKEYDSLVKKIDELLPDKELLTTPYENTPENREKYLSAVKLNKEKLTVYAGGDKSRLSVTGSNNSVKWSSSDDSIAKVTKNGYVYGLKPGKCTIKAVVDGKTFECTVTVKEIGLNQTSLTLNAKETYQLKVNGIKEGIKWNSSNKSVVKVDNNGKVTAVKKGTATIKATVNNVTYSCKVKVK